MTGPLGGVRVIEFVGLGPAPFAAMLLADMGAEVISVTRPGAGRRDPRRFVTRGRATIEIDIKSEAGQAQILALVEHADMLIEGFRPGVMERLGLGPDRLVERNPRLIYGRMTGWGQTGELARTAGHDINYIAISGALDAIRGGDGAPVPPINLLGDYGGGSLYLVMGLLAAYIECRQSGMGQIVDAAIVDGALSLMTPTYAFIARGMWKAPGSNVLDGGAYFYTTYECADGRWLAVGAVEEAFYRAFCEKIDIDDPTFTDRSDKSIWPERRTRLAAHFRKRQRDEWIEHFGASDACVTPVLSTSEAAAHPWLVRRGCFTDHDGETQPAPAPRFSRTPATIRKDTASQPLATDDVIARWSQPPTADMA